MKSKYLYSFFLVFLFIKCQDKIQKKEFVVENEKLYEVVFSTTNDQMMAKYELNEDSIWHGACKTFYKDGTLETLSYYNNGNIEGEKLTFYRDIFVKYYDVLDDDTVLVEHQAYKAYEFYDKNEVLRFLRTYDEKGDIVKDEGSVFVLGRINADSIEVGEKFNGQFYLVNPPGTESDIFVNVFKDSELIKSDTLTINKDYDAGFLLVPFNTPGEYIIQVVGIVDDLLQNKIKQDTLIYSLVVIDNMKKI